MVINNEDSQFNELAQEHMKNELLQLLRDAPDILRKIKELREHMHDSPCPASEEMKEELNSLVESLDILTDTVEGHSITLDELKELIELYEIIRIIIKIGSFVMGVLKFIKKFFLYILTASAIILSFIYPTKTAAIWDIIGKLFK